MNIKEIVDLTNDIVQKYYQNDIQPFLDHVDEKILWYGPANGQFLSGRQAVLNAWADEKHSLTFTLGNVRLDNISTHSSYCEVLMSFPVTTHFPKGDHITVNQIIHITWCERKINNEIVPRMLVVHISDLYHQHEADNIYPVHFNEVYKGYMPITQSENSKQIYFHGTDSADLYLLPDTIIYAESIDYGRHSMLHTTSGAFRVSVSTTTLEKEYPEFLLRCHKCHLVNPHHITSISRFKVTMSNGKELPIPEKKYTAFRKSVNERLFEKGSLCRERKPRIIKQELTV